MVKDILQLENPIVVMFQETKRELCDRGFVGNVWSIRNKEWAALPAFGALGGILIIWDSKKLCNEEVVIGFFLSQSSFCWMDVDPYGCPQFMAQTVPYLGRIFGWSS